MFRFKETPQQNGSTSWVFFALGAKIRCLRRGMAERLGEATPVVLVEQPVSSLRHPFFLPMQRRIRRLAGMGIQYWPFHTPEQFPHVRKPFRLINRRRLTKEIKRLLKRSPTVVCYDSPTQYDLVGTLEEELSVYLAIDDRTVTVWGEPIVGELEAERKLLSKVGIVICVSEPLARKLRERSPSRTSPPIYVLANGYDERLFDPTRKYPEPPMLADITRPRILVTGHVSERIDWEGVVGAIKARPKWTWVFVGPADAGLPEKIELLAAQERSASNSPRRPNLIYHDAVPVGEVPALIAHSDACGVPYRLNSFTRASSPLKAIEYLAMGAPILSTRIPSLKHYENDIQWVEEADGESYANALDKLEKHPKGLDLSPPRQRSVAMDSWEFRVNQFKEIVFAGIYRVDFLKAHWRRQDV